MTYRFTYVSEFLDMRVEANKRSITNTMGTGFKPAPIIIAERYFLKIPFADIHPN